MAHIIYTYKGKVINLSALADQLAVLKIAGSSVSNLSRVFSGRHRPRLDLAIAIARLGDIPVEEMPEMLEHCRKQHANWKYAPVFGGMRRPRETQAESRSLGAAASGGEEYKEE